MIIDQVYFAIFYADIGFKGRFSIEFQWWCFPKQVFLKSNLIVFYRSKYIEININVMPVRNALLYVFG